MSARFWIALEATAGRKIFHPVSWSSSWLGRSLGTDVRFMPRGADLRPPSIDFRVMPSDLGAESGEKNSIAVRLKREALNIRYATATRPFFVTQVLLAVLMLSIELGAAQFGGIVRDQAGHGLPGVQVKVVDVGSDTTTQTGEFKIESNSIRAGQRVSVEVVKEGWVVAGDQKTTFIVPANQTSEPTEIVMVKSLRLGSIQEGVPVTRRFVASRAMTGDLWPSAWAADDSLFFAWGDGTGQEDCIPTSNGQTPLEQIHWQACGDGTFSVDAKCLQADWDCTGPASVCRFLQCGRHRCYPLCRLTRAGIRRDTGPVTDLSACSAPVRGIVPVREDSCIVDRDPPDNDLKIDKKFSSLLVIDGKLYGHMHAPCCSGTQRGFLVVRDEIGWATVGEGGKAESSPWGATSHFRIGMFIQMGKDFSLSKDEYVYMLGIDREVQKRNTPVYLARVPKDRLADPSYAAWEYFSVEGGVHHFVPTQEAATPVLGDLGNRGGGTRGQGSAAYHPGLGKYLFLTGMVDPKAGDAPNTLRGALYWADEPWGPWTRVRTFTGAENRGGVFGLIAKDAGPNCVYFAYAGLPHATILPYTFKVDSLVFGTRCEEPSDCGCGSVCRQGVCKID